MQYASNVLIAPNSTASKTLPHLRMTSADIKEQWLEGYYTGECYLFNLIRSLRADGWLLKIYNISEFCREWQISRNAFYKAKAQLLIKGKLTESLLGYLGLCVNPNPPPNIATGVTVIVSPGEDNCPPEGRNVPESDTYHLETQSAPEVSRSTDLNTDLNTDQITTHTDCPVVVNEIFSLKTKQDLSTPPETFQEKFTDPDPSKISQFNQTQKAQIQNQTYSPQTKETGEDKSSAAAAETEIFEEIKELIAPGQINPQIRALVLEAIAQVGLQVVKDAIAAVKEYKAHQKTKGKELANPVGMFRQALTEKWQPVQRKAPDSFSDWFNLAYNLDLVRAASDKSDITQQPLGVQCVLTNQGEWVTWENYKMQYPLEKLREAATNFSRTL